MEKTKVTKREMFERLLGLPTVQADDELVAFIEHEVKLLDNKKEAVSARKMKETSENAALIDAIVEGMVAGTDYTVTTLINSIEAISELSTSKVTSLLKNALNDGRVVRDTTKGKSVYRLA